MSDKKEHNEPDIFSDLIRQKLENHKIAVDAACWDEIELSLKPRNRRGMRWTGGAAAAAAILILALLFYPDENASLQKLTHNNIVLSLDLKKGDTATVADSDVATTKQAMSKKQGVTKVTTRPQTATLIASIQEKEQETDIIQDIHTAIDTITIPTSDILMASQEEKPEVDTDIQTDTIVTGHGTQVKKASHISSEERLLVPRKENKNSWLLAASFSSKNNTSFSNNDNRRNMDMMSSSTPCSYVANEPAFTKSAELLSTDEFSDIDHAMPLTFGLTVRKDINKHFGVETGLTYTYLSSKFKKKGQSQYNAKQELHYLGVPVNLVVYLWNSPKWNVYVTAGGMVEKGIKAAYVQDVYQNTTKMGDFSKKNSVDGLQWSLNASIGASYTFYEGFGFYVEPRLSHYFDNEQPISIRTEKTTVFGLSGGFRYKF